MSDDGLYHQTRDSLNALSRDLQQQLEQDLTALRAALDERLAALDGMVRRSDSLFERTAEDLANVARRAEQQASEAKLRADEAETRLNTLRTESEAARGTLEARLAEAETIKAETVVALDAARQDLEAVRRMGEEQTRALDAAAGRVRELEAEHGEWILARQVAEAHLEEERQRRKTVAIQLETAHEELRLARAEVKSYRLQVQHATERASRFENGRAALPPDVAAHGDRTAALDQLRRDLQALNDAQSADGVLIALLESLGRQFETATLFTVGAQGLKLWRGRRNGLPFDGPLPVLPLEGESTVSRAFRARASITEHGPAASIVDARPVQVAAAFPVVSKDRVLMIACVDDARSASDQPPATTAEILVDRVNQRLQRPQALAAVGGAERPLVEAASPAPAAESPHYVLTRQARRVTMNEGVKVYIDGIASELIDLSTLGAQIVSPAAIRPNRPVRVELQRDANPIACQARIVWARVERGSQDELVLYRAGVEFTEANVPALQAFASQYGMHQNMAAATAIEH